MNQPPIPSPSPGENTVDANTQRQSPVIKFGRMFLLIVLWCGVAVFGSTAILSVFNAYAVATGFPANVTPGFLLAVAATNTLTTAFCLFFILKLSKKRRA